MKRFSTLTLLTIGVIALSAATCGVQKQAATTADTPVVEVPSTPNPDPSAPTVYFTSDISASGLVKVYEALGIAPAEGQRVAVKISTGDDAKPLQERINRQHDTHIIGYAESIGLGVQKYNLVNIDK